LDRRGAGDREQDALTSTVASRIPYAVNPDAVTQAEQVIRDGRLDRTDRWGDAEPRAEDENAFIDRRGFGAFARWHLAVGPDASADTKGFLHFPYGDLEQVYRGAVITARQRAAQYDHAEAEPAADRLLSLIDEHAG